MKKLATVLATITLVATFGLAACKKKKEEAPPATTTESGKKPDEPAMKPEEPKPADVPAAGSAAGSGTAAPASGSAAGLPECDARWAYLNDTYAKCEKIDKPTRDETLRSVGLYRKDYWLDPAATPDQKKTENDLCKKQTDDLKKSLASMGC